MFTHPVCTSAFPTRFASFQLLHRRPVLFLTKKSSRPVAQGSNFSWQWVSPSTLLHWNTKLCPWGGSRARNLYIIHYNLTTRPKSWGHLRENEVKMRRNHSTQVISLSLKDDHHAHTSLVGKIHSPLEACFSQMMSWNFPLLWLLHLIYPSSMCIIFLLLFRFPWTSPQHLESFISVTISSRHLLLM